MEALLLKLKDAVNEAQHSLEKDAAMTNDENAETSNSSIYRTTLATVAENWHKVSSIWKWLPTFTSSVQNDIADTLRKVFQLVSRLAVTLPQSLQGHVRHFLLSLPSKWASFSFRLTTWTTTTMLFNPKSSLEQLDLLTDLV